MATSLGRNLFSAHENSEFIVLNDNTSTHATNFIEYQNLAAIAHRIMKKGEKRLLEKLLQFD